MDKITIQTNQFKTTFGINEMKYITSFNYKQEYELIKVFKKVFSKVVNSEYDLENHSMWIQINDAPIDFKRNSFWHINEYFDLESDLKLGTRSIMLKYLESKLGEIEYHELSTTIQALFSDISEYMGNIINENLLIETKLEIANFSLKMILKNLEVLMIKEGNLIHGYNMDYEEVIIHQILMLREIAKQNHLITQWVYLTIPHFTDTIYKSIQELPKNIKIIINSNKLGKNIRFENNQILLLGTNNIDLSNDISIYDDFMMSYHRHIELDKAKALLNEYAHSIDKENHPIHKFI